MQTDKSRAHCSVFPWLKKGENPPALNCAVRIGKTWLTMWEKRNIVAPRPCVSSLFLFPTGSSAFIFLHSLSLVLCRTLVFVCRRSFQGSSRRFEQKHDLKKKNQVYLPPSSVKTRDRQLEKPKIIKFKPDLTGTNKWMMVSVHYLIGKNNLINSGSVIKPMFKTAFAFRLPEIPGLYSQQEGSSAGWPAHLVAAAWTASVWRRRGTKSWPEAAEELRNTSWKPNSWRLATAATSQPQSDTFYSHVIIKKLLINANVSTSIQCKVRLWLQFTKLLFGQQVKAFATQIFFEKKGNYWAVLSKCL